MGAIVSITICVLVLDIGGGGRMWEDNKEGSETRRKNICTRKDVISQFNMTVCYLLDSFVRNNM